MKVAIHEPIVIATRADIPSQKLLIFRVRDGAYGAYWATRDNGQKHKLTGFPSAGRERYRLCGQPCTLLATASDGIQRLAIFKRTDGSQILALPVAQFNSLAQ